MMNAQELETAMRLRLDLVALILQDDAYGMENKTQFPNAVVSSVSFVFTSPCFPFAAVTL
jgi:thiamine pyrophosphate-dependent acetolactate synthase large subunit-like protein